MDPVTIVTVGFMVGQFIYHRWIDPPKGPDHEKEIKIPLVAEGTPYPIFFGRVRVRQPILAMASDFSAFDNINWEFNTDGAVDPAYPFVYGLDMLMLIGIPVQSGVTRLHNIWAGGIKMSPGTLHGKTIEDATGAGNHEQPSEFDTPFSAQAANLQCGMGLVEFLDGGPAQEVVNSIGTVSKTFLADRMTTLGATPGGIDPTLMPSFRGFASAFLFSGAPIGPTAAPTPGDVGSPSSGSPPNPYLKWAVGVTPQVPAYSFEVSTYPQYGVGPFTQRIGDEMNPADAIYQLLRDHLAKLGLPVERMDLDSFLAAAITLYAEGHGYSRAFEDRTPALEIIQEILRQIDATIDEDPATGTLRLKLIRADFNPTTIPHITVDNCQGLASFAASGWTGTITKIRATYENRANDYQTDSATAQNTASALSVNAEIDEIVLSYPGVKTHALAAKIAARELAARSRPLAKFQAVVDMSFAPVRTGDAIAATWPELQMSGRIFRVAKKSNGGPGSNSIQLDLVEDFFFLHRSELEPNPDVAPFPGGSL